MKFALLIVYMVAGIEHADIADYNMTAEDCINRLIDFRPEMRGDYPQGSYAICEKQD